VQIGGHNKKQINQWTNNKKNCLEICCRALHM